MAILHCIELSKGPLRIHYDVEGVRIPNVTKFLPFRIHFLTKFDGK